MKKVDIEHLKDEDYVDYIDGDLFLIEDVNKLPTIKENAIDDKDVRTSDGITYLPHYMLPLV